MREIKFRVWDEKESVMWDDMAGDWRLELFDSTVRLSILTEKWIQTDVDNSNCGHQDFYWRNIESNIVVMQYTGLKDKNGKEIYEGDILKDPIKGNLIISVVYFDLCFRVKAKFGIFYHSDLHRCEVIGNIYEHPHLLKVAGREEIDSAIIATDPAEIR